jgi:4-hydroxybutyryl-CoA dehydratase/vinylacetyl-CoA-Delta-isomerase
MGKVYGATKWGEAYGLMHDICGGLVVTMPGEADYLNPETRPYLETYLKGREDILTEYRIRAFKLVEDLIASPFSGWFLASQVNAAGSPAGERIELRRNYDVEKRKEIAKAIAGIQGSW